MFWYLFLATSPIWLMFIIETCYKKPIDSDKSVKKIYVFFCGLVLFIFIGFRNKELGSVDSANYYDNWLLLRDLPFKKLPYIMEESPMEDGYLFTIWCISRVFYEPQFVFILSGLLFSIAVSKTVYVNSQNVMLSMVMYICLGLYIFMVQGLRQSIAISICLLATEYCKKRRLWPFLLCMLLAFCFHRSSIAFAIMYPLYGGRFGKKTKIGALALAGLLMVLSPVLISLGNEFLEREYTETAQSGALVASAIYVIIVAVGYLFTNDQNTDETYAFFMLMTMVGGSFYLMRYLGAQVLDRISFYFMMGQNIALPTVLNRFESDSKRILNIAVCLLSIALFVYRILTSYSTTYLFFWQ